MNPTTRPDRHQKRILFLSVPQTLHGKLGNDIVIDPSIPLPVEIPAGKDKLHTKELSLEMIISGMLFVIAEGKEKKEWIDYYRDFVLTVRPDILDELTGAAIIKTQEGNFDLALEIFNVLQGLFPSSPNVMLNQALVLEEKASLLEQEKKTEAARDITAACELILQEKNEEGMEIIRNYLKNHPLDWNGWFILGWALRKTERWEDGAAALGKAIELGGSSSDIYNELAICLMESGDIDGARRELETALRVDPKNVKIISNMGVLALKNGNNAEAESFFRTVLELDPDDIIAGNWGVGNGE